MVKAFIYCHGYHRTFREECKKEDGTGAWNRAMGKASLGRALRRCPVEKGCHKPAFFEKAENLHRLKLVSSDDNGFHVPTFSVSRPPAGQRFGGFGVRKNHQRKPLLFHHRAAKLKKTEMGGKQ